MLFLHRCALYSVRGIKERKDIYIKGHRVYELTEIPGDTPLIEYHSPTSQNKPLPFDNVEESKETRPYQDILQRYWQPAQTVTSNPSSQVDSPYSSQHSVSNILNAMNPHTDSTTSPPHLNISNTGSIHNSVNTPNRILIKPHINLPMLTNTAPPLTPLSPFDKTASGAALITTPTRFPYTPSLQRIDTELHAVLPNMSPLGKRCLVNAPASGLLLSKVL